MQLCQIHNCALQQRANTAAMFCPLCEAGVTFAGPATDAPKGQGCICPPGANLTCRNPLCPRGGSLPMQIT